jgi:hypothetical protein
MAKFEIYSTFDNHRGKQRVVHFAIKSSLTFFNYYSDGWMDIDLFGHHVINGHIPYQSSREEVFYNDNVSIDELTKLQLFIEKYKKIQFIEEKIKNMENNGKDYIAEMVEVLDSDDYRLDRIIRQIRRDDERGQNLNPSNSRE